jgi:hypothetical protein
MEQLNNREKYKLEAKAKAGWRAFYNLRDSLSELSLFRNNINKTCMESNDIVFLKKQFIELYNKVGEFTDCPICFETLTNDNMDVPNCGHLLCKECRSKIDKCPLCKKTYQYK